MFIAALFTIARTWKHPKCPSSVHICIMEYYSAIKRNKIELFVMRWIDLESVIQSEVNTMHSELDLISARLCFDTAFSPSWLQSKSRYSSVTLTPAAVSEWVIWKSDG